MLVALALWGINVWASGDDSPTTPDVSVSSAVDGEMATFAEIPAEASDTYRMSVEGGPFRFDRDGIVFGNFEGHLPDRERGYYREYTVVTPGESSRGARRLVIGEAGDVWYTADHYDSFVPVDPDSIEEST